MAFILSSIQNYWAVASKNQDAEDLKNWQGFLDSKEKDRQRE